jgi:hypothetical protein
MKAFEITTGAAIRPLPLPSIYRKGDVPAEFYRRQATGEAPRVVPDLKPARFVRTIVLKDGRFTGLKSAPGLLPGLLPGSLLTFVIAGTLTLTSGDGRTTSLSPGDLFLVDEASATDMGVSARENCKLIQVGVLPDWPGAEAKAQVPGTLTLREAGRVNIKRVYKGDDDLAYHRELPELFSAPPNEWSAPRPVAGLRFMCWETGCIDWHPEVVNNLALFLSGELELETSGDRAVNVFHAGDVCLTTDRTGVGHIVRCRGITHIALIVMDTKDLW